MTNLVLINEVFAATEDDRSIRIYFSTSKDAAFPFLLVEHMKETGHENYHARHLTLDDAMKERDNYLAYRRKVLETFNSK